MADELNLEEITSSMTDEPLPNPQGEPSNSAEQPAQPRNDEGKFVSRETQETDEPALPLEEEKPEANAAEDDEAGESDESDGQQEDDPQPNRRRSARERISQLTQQRHEAVARAELAERRFQELQQSLQQPIDPDLEFTDPTAFNQQQLERTLDAREARQLQQQAAESYQSALDGYTQQFQARVEEVRDQLPEDFDQMFANPPPVSDWATPVLAESEVGPQIAYYLHRNRGEAQRIASLPPAAQGAALARIEAKVSRPAAKKTTQAPPPTRALPSGGGAGQISPDSASIDDIAKMLGYGRS